MKCNYLLNWLENHEVEELEEISNSDLRDHLTNCSDCVFSFKVRGEIGKTLSFLPPPPIPENLTSKVFQTIDNAQESDLLNNSDFQPVIDRFLKPIEIGFTLAGLITVLLVFSNPANESPFLAKKQQMVAEVASPKRISPSSNDVKNQFDNSETLVSLTSEEIAEFRRKLAFYNKMHPENSNSSREKIEGAIVRFNTFK
ncbi:MAG: hypothetical protein HQM08_18640 [Candidatus Riflebacteria bacterium]|nr:hypothetical protein [Candidatus Riflebacteria bacterium]